MSSEKRLLRSFFKLLILDKDTNWTWTTCKTELTDPCCNTLLGRQSLYIFRCFQYIHHLKIKLDHDLWVLICKHSQTVRPRTFHCQRLEHMTNGPSQWRGNQSSKLFISSNTVQCIAHIEAQETKIRGFEALLKVNGYHTKQLTSSTCHFTTCARDHSEKTLYTTKSLVFLSWTFHRYYKSQNNPKQYQAAKTVNTALTTVYSSLVAVVTRKKEQKT